MDKHHTVYEAELVGLTLAAELLQQLDFPEDVTIATDNQAAIKAVTSFHSPPGQQIIDFFLSQMLELTNQHRGISFRIYWIPGHKGIPGNKKADKLAKLAAKQRSKLSPILPAILRSPLPHSTTACKTAHVKQSKDILCALFQKSP